VIYIGYQNNKFISIKFLTNIKLGYFKKFLEKSHNQIPKL